MLFGFLYSLDLLSRSHSNRTVIPSKLNAVQYRNGVKYMFMHVQTALMFYTTSSMRRHQITIQLRRCYIRLLAAREVYGQTPCCLSIRLAIVRDTGIFQYNCLIQRCRLRHISFCVTANILTVNSSKTEFMLVRLKQEYR